MKTRCSADFNMSLFGDILQSVQWRKEPPSSSSMGTEEPRNKPSQRTREHAPLRGAIQGKSGRLKSGWSIDELLPHNCIVIKPTHRLLMVKDVKWLYIVLWTRRRNGQDCFLSWFFPEAANSPLSLMVNKIGQAGCSLRGNRKGQRVSLCCCS